MAIRKLASGLPVLTHVCIRKLAIKSTPFTPKSPLTTLLLSVGNLHSHEPTVINNYYMAYPRAVRGTGHWLYRYCSVYTGASLDNYLVLFGLSARGMHARISVRQSLGLLPPHSCSLHHRSKRDHPLSQPHQPHQPSALSPDLQSSSPQVQP